MDEAQVLEVWDAQPYEWLLPAFSAPGSWGVSRKGISMKSQQSDARP